MKKLLVWLALAVAAVAVAWPLAFALRVSPAFAVEAVVASAPAVLTFPVGDWLIELARIVTAFLVPIAATFLGRFLLQVAPALSQMLTNALVDRMVRLAADFALQAVEGAARGRTTSVAVAPAVIALGAQRAVDSTLPWIVAQGGGAEGIAERLFRHLDLEPAASAETVLAPALDALGVGHTLNPA